MKAKRIRVDRLLVPPNLPAGANPLVVMSLVYMYRSTTEDAPPITVRFVGWNDADNKPVYRITDGRHRYMASVIAGRRRVLANVEE